MDINWCLNTIKKIKLIQLLDLFISLLHNGKTTPDFFGFLLIIDLHCKFTFRNTLTVYGADMAMRPTSERKGTSIFLKTLERLEHWWIIFPTKFSPPWSESLTPSS